MKPLLLPAVVLFLFLPSLAFAGDSAKDIRLSVELMADGRSIPQPELNVKDGAEVALNAEISGETPESGQSFDLFVVPTIKDQTVTLKGRVVGVNRDGTPKTTQRKVKTTLQNGKERVLEYKLNGHLYKVKIVASFS